MRDGQGYIKSPRSQIGMTAAEMTGSRHVVRDMKNASSVLC